MRHVFAFLLFSVVLGAATYNWTITPVAGMSYVSSGSMGPISGTVTLPSVCAPCSATSVVITSLPSAFAFGLAQGNTVTSWPVQLQNSFTVTSGVITSALFEAASYGSWGAAIGASQPLDCFSMNTANVWIAPATSGAVQQPVNYGFVGENGVSGTSTAFGQASGGSLGGELTSGSGWTSTGWTGTYNSFTHSTGNTNALTNTLSLTSGNFYQFSVAISGSTGGSIAVSLGGASLGTFTGNNQPLQLFPLLYPAVNIVNTGVASGALSITPTSNFDGTITISVKQISEPVTFS